MAITKKLEIVPQTTSNKITLQDNEWAMYQAIMELTEAINKLERRFAAI